MKRVKIEKWNALVYFPCADTGNDYVISYDDGAGGAVISNPDYETAKKNFIEAMHLCEAVDKLLRFSRTGKF